MGRIFYIMGKSASGKDHIYEYLLSREELKLKRLVLYTTRPIRAGEENGREYYFTDGAYFKKLAEAGKVIESRSYDTVHGIWIYYTADDGQIQLEEYDYLGIGTLESYEKLKDYYGADRICPLYIETEDGIRLTRALARERQQNSPRYAEMCRRFLADEKDFSEEKIMGSGIRQRFQNNDTLQECLDLVADWIKKIQNSAVN